MFRNHLLDPSNPYLHTGRFSGPNSKRASALPLFLSRINTAIFRPQLNGLPLFVGCGAPSQLEHTAGSIARPSPPGSGPADMKDKEPSTTNVPASKRGKRRRGGGGLGTFQPRPRGADGGPLRTPQHIGDAWQTEESYEVEKVIAALYFEVAFLWP